MESLEKISRRTLLTTVRTQLIFELVMKNVKRIVEEKNFSFIVLKGPHLGNTIYDDPVERLYCDLDLLVSPQDFFPVIDLLRSNGYKLTFEVGKRLWTQKEYYCWTVISPYGVAVEIHRDLAGHGRYRINIDGLFERSEPFKIGKIKLLGLGREDLLLHLCLHMIGSYFRNIEEKHVKDIALLTQKKKVNWDIFVERVTDARCSHGVYYALFAAKNQLHAEIPDDILQVLSPRGIRKRWLDSHLDPSVFPIYRFPNHRIGEVQARLGLMLMDRFRDWLPLLWRYSKLRLQDALLRSP